MKLTENKKEKILWVVRHGLRIDFTSPEWVKTAENPYNPPLDPKGITQAEETAERLRNEKIDYIFSSPFIRTLQTASAVAEKKGLTFNVEPGFSEWLKSSEFRYMPDLYSMDYLSEKFPLINPDYKSMVSASYPESQNNLDTRTDTALEKIFDKYDGSILVISHGSPIKSIYKSLIRTVPEDYQPMCSVSMFRFDSGEWKLEIDSDSSHLTIPDVTGRAFYAEKADRELSGQAPL